jgi:tetratricopeptide (TPR) repeat protein
VRALERLGREGTAAAELRRVIAARPDDVRPRIRLAEIYLKLGRTRDADRIAESIARESRSERQTNYVKGIVYLRQGDYEAALEQQRLYNEMVCDGTWPPYQGPADCTKYDAKKFDSAP